MDQQASKGGAVNGGPEPLPQGGGQILPDYSQPVAYDTEGRPLYLQPQQPQPQLVQPPAQYTQPVQGMPPHGGAPAFNPEPHGNHQYVHISRPIAPANPAIPSEIMERYEASRRQHPQLNLSKGEYIISAINRHPFGLLQIWGIALIFFAALAAMVASFVIDNNMSNELMILSATGLGLVSFFIFAGALIATYIYNNNRFYLTNESVIQEIQNSLFNKHEQTVSLANIEDASFYKAGIFSYFFDFGTIRLSTEGDETTYRFTYVSNPKRQIAILNNAVEAFKNGRPVDPNDN